MANIMIYKAEFLQPEQYKIFAGVYNDFYSKAKSEYKFELDPLTCEEFCRSVQDGLLECIVLLEDEIPTAFLAYTTLISDAVELNIIHCLGEENITAKKKVLMEKFLDAAEPLLRKKATTYPMLGKQDDFVCDITHYGFKLIGLAVVRFDFGNPSCLRILNAIKELPVDTQYRLENWSDKYKKDAVKIINETFKEASDALFDPRFLTEEGCKDIVDKIVDNVYGEFLPKATKIIFHGEKPIGICFVNITGNTIGNIPLIGVKKEFRGKSLGKYLLRAAVTSAGNMIMNGELPLSEINASVETDNFPAVKMYRWVGFKEDYHYPQAYRPKNG